MTVKNTGSYAGKEVVELYAAAPAGSLDKPVKELRAYGKTKVLEPGESQTLTLTFATADLASFDEAKSAWVVDAGSYNFLFGASSRDIRCEAAAEVAASETKVNNVLGK